MATKKKMLQAAAGQAGGAGLDITDVFSTYLYTGNGSTQTITNGIDLAGEGGLVWIKNRSRPGYSTSFDHVLYDTERGAQYTLFTPDTTPSSINTTGLTSFNEDGFSLGGSSRENWNGGPTASWSFRKAPKFFDVVTYTGTGSPQSILHDLGCTVGSIFIKNMDVGHDWKVYHVGNTSSPETKALELNKTGASESGSVFWNNTAPTSTQFTVGTDETVNSSGVSYVAYLFAHNDGDGEFGPDGDQDIIKCGSYTSSNPSNRPEVDLGFEPQWLLIKNATASSNWMLVDNMRGLPVNSDNQTLAADSSAAENGIIGSPKAVALTPTGFNLTAGVTASNAGTGNTHIYIAIRRGPLAPPESGTEVFDAQTLDVSGISNGDHVLTTGFPVDLNMRLLRSPSSWVARVLDRLRAGSELYTNLTNAEGTAPTYSNNSYSFDSNTGIINRSSDTNNYSNQLSYSWKRAPSFFDVVAYTGNGVAGRTVSHNLGVAPEMMWVKMRSGGAAGWGVYHKDIGATNYLNLNNTNASAASVWYWNNTTPTESVFTLGGGTLVNLSSSYNYIAYLFATLPGVSKVGSYTGNGSSQTIDCGFTSGARFVLIKSTTETRSWCVFDTARGIVAGNDPVLYLQDTGAEVTSIDWIDPHSSGFEIVTSQGNINGNGQNYIFYAIA